MRKTICPQTVREIFSWSHSYCYQKSHVVLLVLWNFVVTPLPPIFLIWIINEQKSFGGVEGWEGRNMLS